MDKKPSTPSAKRQGFSLVLALVMAAALVIVIIVLAAFLKVESRLAINSLLLTRARLNTVASLRLAQGNMQQMLGPDTRITAPSTAFEDAATTDSFDSPILGVWRSWEGLDHETSNLKYLGRPLNALDYNLKATDNYNWRTERYNPKGRFLGWLTSNSYEPLLVPETPPPPAPPLPPAARFAVNRPIGGTFQGFFRTTPSIPKRPAEAPKEPWANPPRRDRPTKPPVTVSSAPLPLWTGPGNLAALMSPPLAYTSPLVGPVTARRIGETTVKNTDLVTLEAKDFPPSLAAIVTRNADGSFSLPGDGTFAWWVSGENQKALVSLEPPPATIATGTATAGSVLESTRRARTFDTVDLSALGLTPGLNAPDGAISLPSRGSFAAAVGAGYLGDTLSVVNKVGFHDYTTYAPGLLVNVANGGLRRDLSLLAESWDWINQVDATRAVRLPLFRNRPKITAVSTSITPNDPNVADLLYARPWLDSQAPLATGNKSTSSQPRKTLLYWWSDYSTIGQGNIDYTGSTNGTYRGLGFIPPIRSWNTMVDYMLQYRKAVVAGTPNGVVEMKPPSAQGTTGGLNPMYNYHETVYRHPVVARMQFVFSATATTTGAGSYQRHIILQPLITFWNPYNVRLKVPDVSLKVKADQLPIGFSLGLTATEIDPIIYPIGYWFAQGRWDGLVLNMESPSGVMDLGPGETRVYSVRDPGTVRGARVPYPGDFPAGPGTSTSGFLWFYDSAKTPPANPYLPAADTTRMATLKLKPGYSAGYNSGSGVWLTWVEDKDPRVPRTPSFSLAMRKVNTGRDSIGIDIELGAALQWARATPVRFSFGNDIWTDAALWLFHSLYGPDDPKVPVYSYDSVVNGSRPFGTFAFGLRMANDGSTLNDYTLSNLVANSTGYTAGNFGIVSRGTLQSSPFTCYTELGDKSAEVLVYDGLNQIGGTGATQNGIRYFGCMHPINAPFDLWWRPLSGWQDSYAPQNEPTTFRGYVVSGLDAATGLSTAVVAEHPVIPLQSVADLQNWDARGFNPAPPFTYGLIGNSDASPILPSDDVVGRFFLSVPAPAPPSSYRTRNQVPTAFLQHDDRYCLNHVLFDDWFVSSLAPDPSAWASLRDDSKGNDAALALRAAWAKVVDGSAPLANRFYRPATNAAELDMLSQGSVTWTAPNVFSNPGLATAGGPRIPDAWLKLGAYLTVNGQFNVNSTSIPAWTAVLRGLRDQRVPVLKAGTTAATIESVGAARTPLVRMFPSPESLSSSTRAPALTGYNALTDEQLVLLATEIVKQVRLRGPFLSLSEFVNRQLRSATDSAVDPCLRGALQAALEAVQQPPASLTEKDSAKKVYANSAVKYVLNAANYGKPTTPLSQQDKLNPFGFSADYINPYASIGNSNEGLPGWPRQADLLRRLAPIMSVRDETFTVRALGEVLTAEGTARAWCEAVYQRVPEYVDPRIEPWKAPMGDYIPPSGLYPGENPARSFPYMANALFGRRLKLVSFRWLRADEI